MTAKTVNQQGRILGLGAGCLLGFRQGLPQLASSQALRLQARLSGSLATVEVRQAFVNTGEEALEFCFLFPLCEGRHLLSLRAQVAERPLLVRPADPGDSLAPRRENRRPSDLAALFEHEAAPVLSLGVGLLEPGQRALIEVRYAEMLTDEPLRISLCGAPLLGAWSWPQRSRLEVVLEAPVARLRCNLPLSEQPSPGPERVLALEPIPEVSELVLEQSWPGDQPRALMRADRQHFMLEVLPPSGLPPVPRDLLLLVDLSEQATASRLETVQAVVQGLLADLRPEEQFAVVGFHRELEGFDQGRFQGWERRSEALRWLAGRRGQSQASLGGLLERILALSHPRPLTVVLLASGPVGDEAQLYGQVCGCSRPPRWVTVGLGERVHRAFLRGLARRTGGRCFLGSAPRLEALVAASRSPWIEQLEVCGPATGLQLASLTPSPAGSLGGKPLALLGRATRLEGVEVRGKVWSGASWRETPAVVACANPGLAQAWAYAKLAELEDERSLTRGPRADQLLQLCRGLCRDYRLMSEHSPPVVGEEQLAPLQPQRWTRSTRSGPVLRRRPEVVETPAPVPTAPRVARPPGLRARFGEGPKRGPLAKRPGSDKPRLKKPMSPESDWLAREGDRWRQALRVLYQGPEPLLMARVLSRLRALSERCPTLEPIYQRGLICYQGLRVRQPQASLQTRRWVEGFLELVG